ncbi:MULTISPECIES: FecCD family ABC transporter permease [Polyangium]|uniref:Iron ABC transporter permease n=2 Tax=Polyangium TaxID=55 RepID=A0A4U1JC21_9BACT|nr:MULTISPECIES: iron ABC transporter permease [Polyangium]MDI1432293.1 iron ABC transporter permease [Polyangium sorediatum]TKD07588.1 iron ABC transporter permease [Polyangium fumosum]
MIRRPILLAAALLVLVTALALAFGTEPISLSNAFHEPGLARTILLDVRLPRVALAAMAGAGLGVVGAAFQALLRNPLAEPYVLGVSGGAALGATTAIALGLGATTLLGAALIPAASLLGGLLATSLVYGVARGMRGGASGTAILLAGVMVNSMAAALITFLKALVPPSRAQQLLRWLVGFVDLPHASSLLAAFVYVGVGCAVLLFDAGRLNVLVLGDETAGTLGVDVRALERRTFLASSCVVGAIVSLTGLIGFVGLVVPHAVRRLIGPDQRRVLPVSLLAGATMLVGCDLVARLAFRSLGTEPPVGAVTALIGGPAFLVLLRRSGG